MPPVKLMDHISYPQVLYADPDPAALMEQARCGAALPYGQYAVAWQHDEAVYLARDPLGCNKLFFGRDRDGALVAANRIAQVWRCGIPLAAIASCPPGQVLEISGDRVRKVAATDISTIPSEPDLTPTALHDETRALLDRGFLWLARKFAGSRFVVSLSGGLDSSVIASFAAARLPDVVAASFTYLDADDLARCAGGAAVADMASASDDFHHAARVASALGLELLPVVRPRQAVAAALHASVQLCQDWRDFNVHCATVNLFLAQDIRAAFPGESVVVLTGDLMNEYVCDYREERIDDTIYYKIPRIPVERRRKYFVRGLDAGDREIGVFASYRLTACQPFALLAANYMRIPAPMLECAEVKWTLNGPLVAADAAAYVSRAKTRAQVGGKDMGTLGIYHGLGVGEAQLRNVWRRSFPGESATACDEMIQFGRYKMPQYAAGS
jgi:hypothetical protein